MSPGGFQGLTKQMGQSQSANNQSANFGAQTKSLINQIMNSEIQIESPAVQRWFNCEYFYSQMDKAYFSFNSFERYLYNCGIGSSALTTREWAFVRLALRRQLSGSNEFQKSRLIFSAEFVRKEKQKLHEFRSIFRDLTSILNQHKDLISFIFTSPSHDNNNLERYCQNLEGNEDQNMENHTPKNRILFLLQDYYQ